MNDKDRNVLAVFMIFVLGIVVAIAQGKTANENLTEPRLRLEKMLREWGDV